MPKSKSLWIAGLVILVALLTAGAYLLFIRSSEKPIIPKDIEKKLTFQTFLPENAESIVDKESIHFDQTERVLTIAMQTKKARIVFTQQAKPEIFNDGPVYQGLLDKMHQYKEIKTVIGTVTLTRPEELNGGQTAVALSGGTLFFARPDSDLSEAEWQDFFNSLEKN